jgi:uncharacterized damage-inducible protein DinB
MKTTRRKPPEEVSARQPDLARSLTTAFRTNERINQVLLDLLAPKIWRSTPPCTQRRTIASSFAHIHNVRRLYVRQCGWKGTLVKLERATVSMDEVRVALGTSAQAVCAVIERACAAGKVPGLSLDAAGFLCSALTHEAHHRGQICHWARTLGAPIPHPIQLWEWRKRQREVQS